MLLVAVAGEERRAKVRAAGKNGSPSYLFWQKTFGVYWPWPGVEGEGTSAMGGGRMPNARETMTAR